MSSLFGHRNRPEKNVRFYVYVSDSKVDMLLAQIPESFLKRFAAEVTLDVRLLTVKVATRDAPDTRFSRVMAVTNYLYKQGSIGSVTSGATFVEASSAPMRWGLVGIDESASIVFFGGQIEELRVFLTGSPNHVIGNKPKTPVGYHSPPGSYAPPLNVYYDVFADWDEPNRLSDDQYRLASDFYSEIGRPAGHIPGRPVESLSFVARRIDLGLDRNGNRVLIGSPIWVALSEPV